MDCEEIKFPSNTTPDLAATRDLVENYIKPSIVAVEDPQDGTKVLMVVNAGTAIPLDPGQFDAWRVNPRWRSGTATALDLASLIDMANRFGDPDSAIFANNDRRNPSLTVVFDYHSKTATGQPRALRHKAKFAYPLSDEWKAWVANSGKPMSMRDFAAFLEDRVVEVLSSGEIGLNADQQKFVDRLGGERVIAEPAKLMEIATGLRVVEDNETVSAVNLASGEAQVSFKSEHRNENMTVPRLFAIAIPVFTNGEDYQILVRLRYRSTGGQILFFYELWREDRVFDHAFDESIVKVKEETNLPVFLGSPEA